jgi:hypothetical protein
VARDVVGRPGRGAEDAGNALQRLRVLRKQREVGGAARHRLDEVDAARKRRAGIRGRRRGLRQQGHHALHAPLRILGKQGVALARAQLLRARVLRPGGLGFLRRLLEHGAEVPRHGVAVDLQRRAEFAPRREIHHQRDAAPVFLVSGKQMRLRVVQVLQPVLEIAQEGVGRAQLLHRLAGKQAPLA